MKEIILEKAIGKLDTGKEMDERIMKNVCSEMNGKQGKKKNHGAGRYIKAAAVLLVLTAGTMTAGFVAAKMGDSYKVAYTPITEEREKEIEENPNERTKDIECSVKKAFELLEVKNLLPTYHFRSFEKVRYMEYSDGKKAIYGDCVVDNSLGYMSFHYSPEKTELDEEGNAIIWLDSETTEKGYLSADWTYTTKNGWKCTVSECEELNHFSIMLMADLPEGGSVSMNINGVKRGRKFLRKMMDSIPAL